MLSPECVTSWAPLFRHGHGVNDVNGTRYVATDVTKDVTQEGTTDVTEEGTKDVTKDVTQEGTTDVIKEGTMSALLTATIPMAVDTSAPSKMARWGIFRAACALN
jgi:hypothetical protein